ncbi:MAG: glucodextranase DOMON-like domain-containing protein [Meiothermus sp.]|nr:glucodextranase DOMON-like domain-containing protein [Meiothermus sp.]
MIPLLFTDSAGDDYGLLYAYPRAALFAEAGFADLTGFEALEEGGKVVLRVRLSRLANPQNAPGGFSLTTVAVYVDTGPGGETELPGAGFRTPDDAGWERAYLLTGWKSEERRANGAAKPVEFAINGEWLELRPDLPAGDYGYFVATGLYDPFTDWNFRPVRPGGGAWVLDGRAGSPPAVDILTPNRSQTRTYQEGVLPPVRATQNRYLWAALSGAAGLLILMLSLFLPRR